MCQNGIAAKEPSKPLGPAGSSFLAGRRSEMITNEPRFAQSLPKLKQRGDKMMADAHQAVADAQRLAMETAELLVESACIHNRLHEQP